MRCLRALAAITLIALAIGVASGCRPKIKVQPRTNRPWVQKPRPRAPLRPQRAPTPGTRTRDPNSGQHARNRSLTHRITDLQADNLIDGLLEEALGIEDMKDRYQRMTREQQAAVRRLLPTRTQRSRGLDMLRRVAR